MTSMPRNESDPELGRSKTFIGDATFAFRDCNFEVDAKKMPWQPSEIKKILLNVSAAARRGEVLAIMGPSGAGKTMLMNMITLMEGPGVVTGEVTLCGTKLTSSIFQKYCAVVQQVDRHWAFLTTRETVELAADCYLNMSKEEKAARVNDLLKRMGLESCAETKVGNEFMPGLSGGQKRRLSLAVALIKQPLLVFLDEPTSGLDAAAAAGIMSFLKELTHELDIIVVATIHQPSFKVYSGFDGCLVLSNGKTAYNGPANSLNRYLSEAGRPCPPDSSVAEWVLDLVNREFTDPDAVDKLLDYWEGSKTEYADPAALTPSKKGQLPEKGVEYGTSFFSQVGTLLKRHSILTVRDPMLYIGRFVAFMMTCAFFSIIYIEARERTQEQAVYKMFLIMWHLGVPTSLGVVAVYAFNTEFFAIKKEIKDGMYNPLAYITATSILQIPLMFILAVAAISVGGYGISDYHPNNYHLFWIIYAATLWCFEAMAQFFAAMFDNPLLGMLMFMNMWFSSFLFAGVMVPEEEVVWPFRILCYITPYRWALSSMLWVDVIDTTFKGAELTEDGGFTCPDLTGLQCYGYTGEQVLDSIGKTYKSFSSTDHYWRDVGFICLIALVFKLQWMVLVYIKTNASRVPVSK